MSESHMRPKIHLLIAAIAVFTAATFAQDVDPAARAARWREFNKHNFDKFDFAKRRVPQTSLKGLKEDENADDFALLRGVVFGKHGRIFKERSIQEYLDKQPWYKANKNYSNSVLTPVERSNLDLIRITEAEKHTFIEPGDMRVWRS